ncbi:LOW QUALITY PROTEIN: Hypothetical protein PHPALM_11492 [Phytophthora palmivora]|uniref:ZSWIM1/3 RNaseH-like domain-containing protein n=1 Tax=Phytophthora palmivora TaxID=4796 RepID=A0A2P4Y252_9STRA|nr:LOW QUALITY PROTEIN: Hypothetical protein PHPALM_11492 [Phytophthora palmivora]
MSCLARLDAYIMYALVESEHKDNLRQVDFKKNIPDWRKIRIVMPDNGVHKKQVMNDMLSQARQLWWQ